MFDHEHSICVHVQTYSSYIRVKTNVHMGIQMCISIAISMGICMSMHICIPIPISTRIPTGIHISILISIPIGISMSIGIGSAMCLELGCHRSPSVYLRSWGPPPSEDGRTQHNLEVLVSSSSVALVTEIIKNCQGLLRIIENFKNRSIENY